MTENTSDSKHTPGFFDRVGQALKPGRRTTRGAIAGAAIATILVGAVVGSYMFRLGYGRVVDGLLGAGIGAVGLILAALAAAGSLWLLTAWSVRLVSVIIGALAMMLFALQSPDLPGLQLVVALLLPALILGGVIATLTGKDESTSRGQQIGLSLLGVVALGALVAYFAWLFDRGSTDHMIEVEPVAAVQQLDLPDPSEPGIYPVTAFTYGSGTDRHRMVFADSADWRSETVDGEPFLEELTGWRAWLRHWYWGFDRTALPINGRVWAPEGDGPFPIVLIVHGNHNMGDFSDPGYAYLGEHFASRGIITVSVDENFLNGTWMADYDEENDARGWVLLEHLSQWRSWNETTGHPFEGRVDLDRVGLIGHSRGGEAVAVAAAFNQLDHYPDDATVAFDYDFNIRAVIAIAPVDGQYRPAKQSTPLTDVNYLTLHGAHDSDVSTFTGDRQYRRVRFTGDEYRFKSSVYLYGANHGQFNTVWGNTDWGMPLALLLNTEALMSGEDQRRAGIVLMTTFLETTLHDARGYLSFFEDLRTGADWLPETLYINRFEDSTFRTITHFDEDVDVTTGTLDSVRITTENLKLWREQDLGYREDFLTRQNQVVVLGWDSTATAHYTVTLPAFAIDTLNLSEQASLTFALAALDEELPEDEEENEEEAETQDETENEEPANEDAENEQAADEEAADEERKPEPLDFTLTLTDMDGDSVSVALGTLRTLLPPLETRFTRWDALESNFGASTEPVLQTYTIPLKDFSAGNAAFDPYTLRSIRFTFDRSPTGVIALDELGIRQPLLGYPTTFLISMR